AGRSGWLGNHAGGMVATGGCTRTARAGRNQTDAADHCYPGAIKRIRRYGGRICRCRHAAGGGPAMSALTRQPQAGRCDALAPGLRRITAPNPSAMTGPGTNTYLVGEDETVVIDPGVDDPAH